jgi:hypothetical protein
MGSADEIDAHAFEVVADKRYGKFHINKLGRANKISRTESEAIWMYRKVFRNKDFRTWKTFLKKVYKYATKSNQKLFPI